MPLSIVFRGGELCKDGERGTYFGDRDDIKPAPHSPFYNKPANLYNTGQAVCGAMGCTRACMISLEGRGVLKNKFNKPFRRKKLWSVDWSDYEPVEFTNTSVSELGAHTSRMTDGTAKENARKEVSLNEQHSKEAD